LIWLAENLLDRRSKNSVLARGHREQSAAHPVNRAPPPGHIEYLADRRIRANLR